MKTLADYKGAVQSYKRVAESATDMTAKRVWQKMAQAAQTMVEKIEQHVLIQSETKGTQ